MFRFCFFHTFSSILQFKLCTFCWQEAQEYFLPQGAENSIATPLKTTAHRLYSRALVNRNTGHVLETWPRPSLPTATEAHESRWRLNVFGMQDFDFAQIESLYAINFILSTTRKCFSALWETVGFIKSYNSMEE